MTGDSRASEALTAAAKQRAEYEKNVRQQMLEQPDLWQFVYAYAFGAMEAGECFDERDIKGLTRAQTVLFLSGVTTILEIISGTPGLKLAKAARQTAIIGGWVLRGGPDSEAAEAYLLRESRGHDHPKTSFTLAFSHPADPFAVLWISITLDQGAYGMDNYGARLSLPKVYYSAANAFLSEGDLISGSKIDTYETLDPKIGRKSAQMRRHSNSGRDGWGRRFMADISEMPLEDEPDKMSFSGSHVVFHAGGQDRML